MRTVGVLNTAVTLPVDDALFVDETTIPSLAVQVYSGEALILGTYWKQSGDPYTLAINANPDPDDRIDLVVLESDFTTNISQYVVVEGTPAPSPVAPTPTQNFTVWQMPLAEVYVASGASVINSGDITDVRIRSTQGDGPAPSPTLGSAGGESLVVTGSGSSLSIRGLDEGNRIDLTSSSNMITIDYVPPDLEVCVATNTMNIPVTDSSEVVLTFDTNLDNPTGMHSTSVDTDLFNINTEGFYNINFNAQWDTNASCTGYVYLIIRLTRGVSDADVAQVVGPIPDVASGELSLSVSRTIHLLAGDVISFVAKNESGQNLNIVSAAGTYDAESPVASLIMIST